MGKMGAGRARWTMKMGLQYADALTESCLVERRAARMWRFSFPSCHSFFLCFRSCVSAYARAARGRGRGRGAGMESEVDVDVARAKSVCVRMGRGGRAWTGIEHGHFGRGGAMVEGGGQAKTWGHGEGHGGGGATDLDIRRAPRGPATPPPPAATRHGHRRRSAPQTISPGARTTWGVEGRVTTGWCSRDACPGAGARGATGAPSPGGRGRSPSWA